MLTKGEFTANKQTEKIGDIFHISDRRFWLGKGIWFTIEAIYAYRRYVVVPSTRIITGNKGIDLNV